MGATPRTGSFGSLAADGVDGGLAVLGEVFEAFDRLEAQPPQERQRRISQGGEQLRGVASVGARLILAAGNIADIMQLVLDAPMLARQFEQACGTRLLSGQAK